MKYTVHVSTKSGTWEPGEIEVDASSETAAVRAAVKKCSSYNNWKKSDLKGEIVKKA